VRCVNFAECGNGLARLIAVQAICSALTQNFTLCPLECKVFRLVRAPGSPLVRAIDPHAWTRRLVGS